MPPKQKSKQKRDWEAFFRAPERELKEGWVRSTRRKVEDVKKLFQSWVEELPVTDWKFWLRDENFGLKMIEGFLTWYLDEHNIKKRQAFLTTARYFAMFCNEERGKEAPYALKQKVKTLVGVTLSDEYELERAGSEQPPFSIDDVLFTTYHLLVWCPITFPTMRSIFQLNTLRKMMTSTTARPGTLIESSGYLHGNDALKWKDIELYMVTHPDCPTSQVLLMRVRHRLNKGRRNEGVPPIFTYTERNDNLGLCVIQDILMYAFLDDAFESEHIKQPRDIWRLTTVPEHRLSTPITFKESVKEIPLMRRATRNEAGLFVTDPQHALQYHQARSWEAEASESAGFKDKGTLYKYRKGAAANIRNLDEASRNRIMGHVQGGTFAKYVSVMDDTQSIFMGTPARKSLLSLATHASLTRDPSAPQDATPAQRKAIELDPGIVQLKGECEALRRDLVMEYGMLKNAKESSDKRFYEFQSLQNQIKSKRYRLCKQAKAKVREEFFRQVGNSIIESNHLGEQVQFTPDTNHIQPERITLANLEFKNRDVNEIDDAVLIEDRIRSLELRLELNRLHMPSGLKAHIRFNENTSAGDSFNKSEEENSVRPQEIKAEHKKERSFEQAKEKKAKQRSTRPILRCPICLGRTELHPAARTFTFSRRDALARHFKSHRLPIFFDKPGRQCDIPGCVDYSASLPRYQLHLSKCHNISL